MLRRLKGIFCSRLACRENAIRKRLEDLTAERDSLFKAFEVARQDVAFERSDGGDSTAQDEDLRDLDRASESVRNGIRRLESRMALLRRRADRCRDLSRRMAPRPQGR